MTTPSIAPSPADGIDAALSNGLRQLHGHPQLAAQQARRILQARPGHPGASLLLCMAANAQGDFTQALALMPLLLRAWPRMGRAWLVLAEARFACGDHAGAGDAYREYLRLTHLDRELEAAGTALAQGRLQVADALLQRRLEVQPGDVEAVRMQADLAMRRGRNDEALALLDRVLQRAPRFDAARQNRAVALKRLGRHPEALAEIDVLRVARPDSQAFDRMKAVMLGELGDFAAAIAVYEDALRKWPRDLPSWIGYAGALKAAGRTGEAVRACRHAIALDPGAAGAWWSLANLKTVRFDAADIAAMQAQVKRADLDAQTRCLLGFALGKALEDAAHYADAFACYAAANALQRQQAPYDADRAHAETTALLRIQDRAFFAARAGSGCDARDPIFVVGMPRSGSTLIEQILSSHPLVEGTTELPEIPAIVRELGQGDAATFLRALAGLDRDALRALGEDYLRRTRVQRKTGRPLFIDKMPNNFAHIGLIHLILPNAKIIDARRHPLACCFSNFKQHFARGQTFSYDLTDMGRYYADYVALMAHFDEVLPGRVHRVIYEQMVDDTEAQVRALLDYCGLDFDERCLRFFENDRAVRTASSEQVRRPIYRDGVDQWRQFEAWLDPLKQALGPVLEHYPAVPPREELPVSR